MIFTTNVKDYLQKLDVPFNQASGILVDKNGIIQRSEINSDNLFTISPAPGSSVEDILPSVSQYLSELRNIYLPNIQSLPDKYVDIHILNDKDTSWILLIDVTKKALKYQSHIENYNTEVLKKKEDENEQYHASEIAIYKFGGLILKHVADDTFKVTSKLPFWFNEPNSSIVSLGSSFPYLETFYNQYLEEEGQELISKKLDSGCWIQQVSNSKELYLQAFAFQHLSINYLFIYPSVFTEGQDQQLLIQKARENVLAYEKLAKQEKQLQRLLKFKEQFASIISHDFRTPLSGLSISANMLLEDNELVSHLNDDQIELLTMMKEELDLLSNYNNKIYNWSKLENESFKLDIHPIDIARIFKDIVRKFMHKLKNKDLTTTIKVEEMHEFEGDELLLTQALSNLVENSIKFSNQNGKIELEAIKDTIIIRDFGIGMSQEVQDKLFGELQNESRRGTNGEKGTGLGLNIVKKIISSHGFRVHTNSKENEGTEFIIKIA